MRPTIKSYEEAALFLGRSSERSTGQRGTKVVRLTPTEIAVRYHNTDVVVYHHPQLVDRFATLDCGGWSTRTTVARLAEYAPLGVVVQQRDDGAVVVVDAINNRLAELALGRPYVMARQHSLNWRKLVS